MNGVPTLNHLFFNAVDRFSSKEAALRFKADGRWHDISHQSLAQHVRHIALGLRELGIEPGDRVAILSTNRPEWAATDFACLTMRCADVPVYPNLPAHHIEYLLNDSEARAIFVEDQEQFDKIAGIRERVPALQHVISFEPLSADSPALAIEAVVNIGRGAETKYPSWQEDALQAKPDDVATLIYTSGTTGEPKGVILTHGNMASNVAACTGVLPVGPSDVALSLLPLSHSFERTAGLYVMFHAGVTIAYAESIDAVSRNLTEVRPTVMLAVPRLYEKIYARVVEAAGSGVVKKRIFEWARRVGAAWVERRLAGEPVGASLAMRYRLADRLVFSKLRRRTGGRLRYFVSGGAPLMPDVATFFHAARLPILEGYGLTETSPVLSVNPLHGPRVGTVGQAVEGVELRIADDGEILARGPNIMRGYYKKPDKTREAIDAEGWFHTGDIGHIDDHGYLHITDRKKDIIVTAGGKNIAPQPIENQIKTSTFIANCVMLGDRRKFPIVLVVPERDAVEAWAKGRQLAADDFHALLAQPDVTAKIEREVMVTLRDVAGYERPKKLLIVEEDFTVENGLMTPKLSVKRREVEARYRDQIEALYAEPPES